MISTEIVLILCI